MVRADSAPYLSVVTVMRNDDYGGHLLHRFRRSIQTLGVLRLPLGTIDTIGFTLGSGRQSSVFGFQVSVLHGIVPKDVV